jgi:hypothetical protein
MAIHCAPGTSNPVGALVARVGMLALEEGGTDEDATEDGATDDGLSARVVSLLHPTIATSATAASTPCGKLSLA